METGLEGKELRKYETETTVNFNELEDFALVYTSSKKVMNKLIKQGYEMTHQDKYGASFKCAKSCISFRDNKPKKKRQITEEHKQKLLRKKNESKDT